MRCSVKELPSRNEDGGLLYGKGRLLLGGYERLLYLDLLDDFGGLLFLLLLLFLFSFFPFLFFINQDLLMFVFMKGR